MLTAATPRASVRQFAAALLAPHAAMESLGENPPSSARVFFGSALWLGLFPPLFAYIGTIDCSVGASAWSRYSCLLQRCSPSLRLTSVCCCWASLARPFVSRWMASTYGAEIRLGRNVASIAMVGAPLAVGSVVHLYPNAFINLVVLVPALMWSMYLLYRGLPVVLKTEPGRGMLMASSLIAYLLVAWVTLLGITVVLWSHGMGPRIVT